MRRWLFFLLLIPTHVCAAEPETLLGPAPPYAPRKIDYSLETGLLTAKDDLFWGGALIGTHLGRCIFSQTETCQQYLDGLVGVGLREGETQGHYWLSLRWQFVNFPDRYSPYARVLAGAAFVARPEGRLWKGVAGAGLGITTYLHDKLDLRIEARAIGMDRTYAQLVLGVNIKVDRLLSQFAQRLKDLGFGIGETAIKATGTAIKATGEGLGGIVNGVSAPFRDSKRDQKSHQKSHQKRDQKRNQSRNKKPAIMAGGGGSGQGLGGWGRFN